MRGQGVSASPLESSSRSPLRSHRTASTRRQSMEIMERVTAVTWVVVVVVVVVVVGWAVAGLFVVVVGGVVVVVEESGVFVGVAAAGAG